MRPYIILIGYGLFYMCDASAQSTFTPGTKGVYGTGGAYVTPGTTKTSPQPSAPKPVTPRSTFGSSPSNKPSRNAVSSSSGHTPSPATSKREKTVNEMDTAAMNKYKKNIAAYRKETKAIRAGLAAKPIFCESCKTGQSIADLRVFVKNLKYLLSTDEDAYRKILDYASVNIQTDHLRELTEEERILLLNSMEQSMTSYNMTERVTALKAIRKVALTGSKNLKLFYTGSVGNTTYGYKDEEGTIIVEAKYTDGLEFAEGLAAVRNDYMKWGYIDMAGKTVIPFDYKYAGNFGQYSPGLANVFLDDGTYFYIDKTGIRR